MAAAGAVRGVDNRSSGTSAATGVFVTLTAPAGVQPGDQLLAGIELREPPSTLTGWRAPAGWTLVSSPPQGSGSAYLYRATYGDGTNGTATGTSWTWDNGAGNTTTTRWAASLICLNGQIVGAYLDSATQAVASAATVSTPPLTVGGLAYLVAMAGSRTTGGPTFTWPSGWVEEGDVNTGTATNSVSHTSGAYDTTPAGAGTYSVTVTPTATVSSGYAAIVAYSPAAGLNLTGAGALTLAGVPRLAGQLTRTGSGTLTTGVPPAPPASGALAVSGSGQLTLAGVGTWPHLSLTATPEPGNMPPRVRIDITDTRTTPAASLTVLRRNPSGRSYPVRTTDGGPLTLSAGQATIYDYELTYGAPVTYSTDQTGGPTVTAELDVPDVWLIHVGSPSRSMTLDKIASRAARTRKTSSTGYQVAERADPLMISGGARAKAASQLVVRTRTDAERQALDLLLDDDSPLLLNIPPSKGWGMDAAYIQVLDVVETPTVAYGPFPYREWTLPYQVISRPGGGNQAAVTWDTVAATYSTWQSIIDAGITSWAQLAAPTT